jgi:hypothetical protein
MIGIARRVCHGRALSSAERRCHNKISSPVLRLGVVGQEHSRQDPSVLALLLNRAGNRLTKEAAGATQS